MSSAIASFEQRFALPVQWRDFADYLFAFFSRSARDPFHPREEKREPATMLFDWEQVDGARARISDEGDHYSVSIPLGAYLRLQSLTLLMVNLRDARRNLIERSEGFSNGEAAEWGARFLSPTLGLPAASGLAPEPAGAGDRPASSLSALNDLILDAFRRSEFSEPLPDLLELGESRFATLCAMNFVFCHEISHYWYGHFLLRQDDALREEAGGLLKTYRGERLHALLELQADAGGASGVASVIAEHGEFRRFAAARDHRRAHGYLLLTSTVGAAAISAALFLLEAFGDRLSPASADYLDFELRELHCHGAFRDHLTAMVGPSFNAAIVAGVDAGRQMFNVLRDKIPRLDHGDRSLGVIELTAARYEGSRLIEFMAGRCPGGRTREDDLRIAEQHAQRLAGARSAWLQPSTSDASKSPEDPFDTVASGDAPDVLKAARAREERTDELFEAIVRGREAWSEASQRWTELIERDAGVSAHKPMKRIRELKASGQLPPFAAAFMDLDDGFVEIDVRLSCTLSALDAGQRTCAITAAGFARAMPAYIVDPVLAQPDNPYVVAARDAAPLSLYARVEMNQERRVFRSIVILEVAGGAHGPSPQAESAG